MKEFAIKIKEYGTGVALLYYVACFILLDDLVTPALAVEHGVHVQER